MHYKKRYEKLFIFFTFGFFQKWCKETQSPFVLYFHPWELDTIQTEITAVGKLSKIKQYRNLGKMEWLLPNYFQEDIFQSVNQYLVIPLEYTNDKELQPRRESGAVKINLKKDDLKPCTLNLVPVTIVIPCYNESSS